jgi:spoIIIJ-associated protein
MIQIEAVDLESAILEASKQLGCEYSDVDYFILQEPIQGLFGVGRKDAIIIASIKVDTVPQQKEAIKKRDGAVKSLLEKKDNLLKKISQKIGYEDGKEAIENPMLDEIEINLKRLISLTCFEIDRVEVSLLNNETVSIIIDGKDAPLLIGREGYRYKAMAFTLQNWINSKYNLKIQLEIGEFIKKQSENIEKYLQDEAYREIEKKGFFKTKILDDLLIKLAIKKLRDRYRDKYVKVRNTQNGDKFIVIDEFFTKKV